MLSIHTMYLYCGLWHCSFWYFHSFLNFSFVSYLCFSIVLLDTYRTYGSKNKNFAPFALASPNLHMAILSFDMEPHASFALFRMVFSYKLHLANVWKWNFIGCFTWVACSVKMNYPDPKSVLPGTKKGSPMGTTRITLFQECTLKHSPGSTLSSYILLL
jgi:hypothetical protein